MINIIQPGVRDTLLIPEYRPKGLVEYLPAKPRDYMVLPCMFENWTSVTNTPLFLQPLIHTMIAQAIIRRPVDLPEDVTNVYELSQGEPPLVLCNLLLSAIMKLLTIMKK